MASRSDDDATLSGHSSTLMLGRMRAPTSGEASAQDSLFRPDAVIALHRPPPLDASPFELHVASLIDGVRPVARIKKRSGLSSADLRIALGMLRDRNLLKLVGIVEDAQGPYAAEIEQHAREVADEDVTKPNRLGELIPYRVMQEIKSMIADDDDDD